MIINRAAASFFTDEEMVAILDLDSDYLSDAGQKARLEDLSYEASDFLLNRTGYDWSADSVKDPTAKICSTLWVKMHFYLLPNGQADTSHNYSEGIESLLNDLILKVREAEYAV